MNIRLYQAALMADADYQHELRRLHGAHWRQHWLDASGPHTDTPLRDARRAARLAWEAFYQSQREGK